jgi:osmotically-inducible protein OsmY
MSTDEKIRKDVIEEIRSDPQLSGIATQVGVTVKDEVVTLTGMVDFYHQKLAAEKAAHRVKDVKVVAMDIAVRSSGKSGAIDDSEIAGAIRNALIWHSAVNEDLVNIIVEDGWVYLDGMVDWDYERSAAEKSVEHIRGVKGVINRVKIKQQEVDPVEVKNKITAAFRRHANVDSASINVDTRGSRVILTGRVRSWTERKDAEDVAWLMPGVTEVDNKLEIEYETYAGE